MPDAKNGKRLWIPFLLGIIVLAGVLWFARMPEDARDGSGKGRSEAVPASPANGKDGLSGAEIAVPDFQIAAGGRLAIRENDLPREGALALALELSDEARGEGPRTVRVVSVAAGRLDAQAIPLPGVDAGMRLEIDRGFLARGVYMIEIDTVDQHPLKFRRYVLEIQ